MRLSLLRLWLAATLAASLFSVSCGSEERKYPVRTYNMGERIQLGHIVYLVFETQWMTHIGDGPEARVPQNRFFLIRLSAVNSSNQDVSVPAFSIQDDSGNTYNEISDGTGVPQWISYLRTVKPAESAQGNALFDAPPRRYKLKIQDEDGERTALIDIPLNFGAETPDIIQTPEKKEK
ncbi:MAG TPA: DUF4352 domain-containing protein [Candidatus Solibacter sp.]|nr:DUF4352 domain-containing protein [Candidatus Solibacter sp.]